MKLTELAVKNAKAKDKPYKLTDGDGLYLHVTAGGSRLWRLKYRYDGKEKLLSFGGYPDLSLSEARGKRQAARNLLANGFDPSVVKQEERTAKAERQTNSFECIAREWHKKMVSDGAWTADHAGTIMTRMEQDMFPHIGIKPITEVSAKDIRGILDRVKDRGAVDTARRCRTVASQVFTYAIGTDRAEYNIATSLSKHLPAVSKTRKHMASITEPKELVPLLRAIDDYPGGFVTKSALQLLPLLYVRPGELRQMEWSEIDFETAEWNIPAAKMKMKVAHLVPLSVQAIGVLTLLKSLTGSGKYVFPSTRGRDRCLSDNTINSAFRRMDFDGDTIVAHGFRATARTILDEILGFRVDFIEHQLGHAVKDPNGRAYNRTAHLPERRKMMQAWSDYLDALKAGAKVLPFKKAA